jgi:hypothetical protein
VVFPLERARRSAKQMDSAGNTDQGTARSAS